MKNKKQVSVMAGVVLALGATTTFIFPSFSEATPIGGTPPDDASYIPTRTAKCGQTQASGSSQGDRRIFALPATKGKKIIRISYQMLNIPDKLQVIYEGKEVLNTGFVSGRKTRTIAVNGKSNQLTIVLTGNSDEGTLWRYRVDCPK